MPAAPHHDGAAGISLLTTSTWEMVNLTSRRRHTSRRLRPAFVRAAAAVAALAWAGATASAQTSLTGGSLALKSNTTSTLGTSNGYVGTYLLVPAGGATVNFTINASASAGATAAPHMNLAIADTLVGFNVGSTSATN